MIRAVTLYRPRRDPLTISAEVWEGICGAVWGGCPSELSEAEAAEFAGLIRWCQREAPDTDPQTAWLEWRADKLREVAVLREFLEGVGAVRAKPATAEGFWSPTGGGSELRQRLKELPFEEAFARWREATGKSRYVQFCKFMGAEC